MPVSQSPRRGASLPFLLAAFCLACCPAWRSGAEGVHIADQEILVYYDSKAGIEHFVRRADFYSTAMDFGFLVPTPTQPKLSETPDEIFDGLAQAIKPKVEVVERNRYSFVPLVLAPFLMADSADLAMDAADIGSVELLDTAMVGGFEAAVLRADKVDALLAWLEENGYDARPDLKEWLQPYIDKQWIVTAFKYDPGANTRSVTTAAVCMSFATEAPFFPYRVPKDQLAEPGRGSLLRVYYLGDDRVQGDFENSDEAWPGRIKFSDAIEDPAAMLEGLGDDAAFSIPEQAWLTAFEDRTWPGGTDDLYFTASADPDPVIPPPIIRYNDRHLWFPPDLILGGCALVFFVGRRIRRAAS